MLDKFPPWLIKFLSKIRFTLFPVLLCCVFFFASDVSVSAVEFDAYNGYSVYWSNLTANTTELAVTSYINGGYTSFFEGPTSYSNGVHHVSNNAISGMTSVSIGSAGDEFYFPYNPQNYKYYLVGVVQSVGSSDWTPERLQLTIKRADGSNNYFGYYFNRAENVLIDNNQSNLRGFSFSVPIDFSSIDSAGISTITLISSSPSSIGNNINFACSVVEIPIDTSAQSTSSIIAAIQNQTSTLGGKIDDTNDLINNGNDNTGALINDVSSANDELNEIWGDYEEIESGIIDDFESSSAELAGEFTGFSWASAGSAVVWVAERLTQIYEAMGDFQMLILFPLLLGIAMFFIGRGKVIFSNLGKGGNKDD